MKRTGKVVPFPLENPSGNSLKVFAVIFYLFLAYFLTLGAGLSIDGISILCVLGTLYHFFVRQRVQNSSYFQKNKVLLGVLLIIFVLAFREMALMLLALAVLYWLLVGRHGREAPYFLRFHILTALILNFFILMPALLIQEMLALVGQLLNWFKLDSVLGHSFRVVQAEVALLFMGVIAAAALWLSVSALMGRTPYIGVVTPNVRHWS